MPDAVGHGGDRSGDRAAGAERLLDAFVALSTYLTGVVCLTDRELARQYLGRCQEQPEVREALPSLLSHAEALAREYPEALSREYPADLSYDAETPPAIERIELRIRQEVMADDGLRAAARQIIYLWYAGAFFAVSPGAATRDQRTWQVGSDPDHYGRGLVWPIIRAHAPMTWGGGKTYWAAEPDLERYPEPPPPGWLDREDPSGAPDGTGDVRTSS